MTRHLLTATLVCMGTTLLVAAPIKTQKIYAAKA